MAGLPEDDVVGSSAGGWTRTPASDDPSDYWSEWRVDTLKDGDNPYLDMFFRNSTAGSEATVTRDLGEPTDSTTSWQLDMMVNYSGYSPNAVNPNYMNNEPYGGQRLEVLDDSGRPIATFAPKQISWPDDGRIYGNDAIIAEADVPSLGWGTMLHWQPLRISAANGQVTFQYAGYPAVTTGTSDTAADWRRAKTLRFYFWTTDSSAPYPRTINVDGVHFNTTRSPAVILDLMDGLPASGSLAGDAGVWRRDPVTEDQADYWSMWRVDMLPDPAGTYLDIFYRNNAEPNVATVTRDLGTPSDTTSRWQLDMDVNYVGYGGGTNNYPNHEPYGGQRVEVLDDADRVVASFALKQISWPDDARLYGNDAVIAQGDSPTLSWVVMAQWEPLRIVGDGDVITFSYGAYAPGQDDRARLGGELAPHQNAAVLLLDGLRMGVLPAKHQRSQCPPDDEWIRHQRRSERWSFTRFGAEQRGLRLDV